MCLYEENSAKLEISPPPPPPPHLLSPPGGGEGSDERGMLINCFTRMCTAVRGNFATERHLPLPFFENRFPRECASRGESLESRSWPGEMRHNNRSSGMRHLYTFSSSMKFTPLSRLSIADLLTGPYQ